MNKGFKGIVITLALVLALTLAVGLSACNETEYYSVSTECNVDQSIAQITVSPSTNTQGYQKCEAAYVTVAIAPGSKYAVESVSANGTALSCGQDGKYNFTVEGDTKISVQIIQTTDVALTVSADDEKVRSSYPPSARFSRPIPRCKSPQPPKRVISSKATPSTVRKPMHPQTVL